MATSGPGAIHLLNGLYDAKLDHAPVVAIVGQQAPMSLGANYQQEVDLASLFKDVATSTSRCACAPEQAAPPDRPRRCGSPRRRDRSTCVIVPNDVQEAQYSEPPRAHGAVSSSVGLSSRASVPRDDDLQRAADVLNAGRAGGDADRPGRERRGGRGRCEVADLLGAGVAKALNGRAVAARRPALRHRLDRAARDEADRTR